ncbi:plasmid pRiA4b ORF-3 family protein [Mucilaginibacter sp. FT3.2]|uniref:plasmid pRiA4b ORF-3 family protein n=1 Tax=Mucilaginibacter sp. FT3.2 TaxID=2723090 RepID=UPI0016176F4D|nr:plasmid pRiA4b ORF-3 family protein [Mucilaginibacter sp. FT3.2]MBB6229965.1 hypothetical protein [Mucilaginibacter sp. FT3.2]
MKTFQFKITLVYTDKPVVWRRVLVPDEITFADLHEVIQEAFGWEHSHLYQFSEKGWGSKPCYQSLDEYDGDGADIKDSNDTLINEVLQRARQKYTYIYDFGDDWKHEILLEKILDKPVLIPLCTDGEGACPPEDCGGVPGYYNMVDVVNNSENEEHEDTREWMGIADGEKWDVSAFDLEAANARCTALASDE